MAGSKYAYVRNFELPDPLLPGTFMVFRLDGHSFHRFSDEHKFTKPNDTRALELMDHAAKDLMEQYPDIVLGFGESDEFSFLIRKSASLYNRRQSKIVSTLTSLFTSSYVFRWASYFPDAPLKYPPAFDGRIILYPGIREIRDYFSWRQTDTHINNLYNTVFWALVQQGGESTTQAHATLEGTVSKEKHEILFSRFNVNYNAIDARFRKGSTLVREEISEEPSVPSHENVPARLSVPGSDGPSAIRMRTRTKPRTRIVVLHCDIIKDEFWDARPDILLA
ncbi:Thg1 C terminal domain-containing protein [Mycena maculata]|uniref:tRNA(His) guanylyltransferase n=1 Tax=Mycena maculata TaxID=230809 RepID=A0AAD7MW32_9AGAR|nr:Thg1 C terminal domain-containing protein [Mycena maculata]